MPGQKEIDVYLLTRKISPYTHVDLLLGCYKDLGEAQKARTRYISWYQDDKEEDPWKRQALHTVDLEQDVLILDHVPELEIDPASDSVFVVSSTAEAFGQDVRMFQAICGSESAARAKAHEVRQGFSGQFSEYCSIDKVIVGELLKVERPRIYQYDLQEIDDLKKSSNIPELEILLLKFISINEGQGIIFGGYYLELAKLYQAQGDYANELAVLERLAKRLNPTILAKLNLNERIEKAREMLAGQVKHSK